MKTTEAVRMLLSAAGVSMRAASANMGRTENYVSSALGQAERMRADMNASTVAGIAAACGYALVLIPKDEAPEDAIVVDPPERG